ncbi:MAG TPA: hypothetical protein VGM14_21450 [Streptosporangiaceae bacterium]
MAITRVLLAAAGPDPELGPELALEQPTALRVMAIKPRLSVLSR